MTNQCPLLTRKSNLLGRIEAVPGTAVTLTPVNDGIMRVYAGLLPTYDAPRNTRDIVRATLTPIGTLESTKALEIGFRTESNTRDTIANLVSLDVDTIDFVSAIAGGAGSIQRITFNGTPDLSGIVPGDYLDINYATNTSNWGTFLITLVNDGSDFVEVVNRVRLDASDDEVTDSPAIGDIQNVLEFQWAFNSCLAQVKGLSRAAIGSVTVADFVRNEIVTGGTSGGTARVVRPTEDGDSHIYFVPIVGSARIVAAEVLTGGTSGAVATTSTIATVNGHYGVPVSGDNCDAEVATWEYQNDGKRYKARSSAGNMTFENAANNAMFLDFTLKGPRSVIDDKVLDTVTRDNEDPPILKNAELKLDAFSPVFKQMNFDMGITVSPRENGNALDDTGFEGFRGTARSSNITLTLEDELESTFAFFGKLDAGTKVALAYHCGTVLGKQCWFFADELEFGELPLGDADGIRTLDVGATCTGNSADGDDDWEFLWI